MFFAVVFEAFAVFNLFNTLQAYLEPFRLEVGDLKEPKDTKIMFVFKLHLYVLAYYFFFSKLIRSLTPPFFK